MKCGQYCEHLVRFYSRLGIIKAVQSLKRGMPMTLPKINVGDAAIRRQASRNRLIAYLRSTRYEFI